MTIVSRRAFVGMPCHSVADSCALMANRSCLSLRRGLFACARVKTTRTSLFHYAFREEIVSITPWMPSSKRAHEASRKEPQVPRRLRWFSSFFSGDNRVHPPPVLPVGPFPRGLSRRPRRSSRSGAFFRHSCASTGWSSSTWSASRSAP